MRRRRAGAADEGLNEALLAKDEASELQDEQWQRQQQQQVIVHTPFDLDAFLHFIWERWTALLRAISDCLRGLLGQSAAPLSLVQAARVEELQARVGVPYDPTNTLHQEGLKELWDLAFPGIPCSSLKSPQWKEMGWQGNDPTTDFRAAGLLGLDSLLYLGRTHPALFGELLRKTRGARSSWEYPFGAASMNVTWMLVELLQLQESGQGGGGGGGGSSKRGGGSGGLTATAAGRGFLGLVSVHSSAFEEVYCAAFDVLDRVWLERGATYMEFNQVLKEVRERVRKALAAQPADVEALRVALGLPREAAAAR